MPPTQASRQDCLIDFQLQLWLQLHVLLVQLALVAHEAAGGHAVDILPGWLESATNNLQQCCKLSGVLGLYWTYLDL